MSARLSDISAHIANVRQLEAVVTAIRGIAASHAQQSRARLGTIETYLNIIARAIGELLRKAPPGWEATNPATQNKPSALILFCTEGGFCGGLSDHVLNAVASELLTSIVFGIGTRGIAIARERGVSFDWTAAMANQIGAAPAVAERVAEALYTGIAEGQFIKADVIYPRPEGSGFVIERMSLLPFDVGRFLTTDEAQPPRTDLPFETLIEQMANEYVYAQLCNAAIHAFEAENEARVAAMVAARAHIEETLVELLMHEHRARQEEITNEIAELSASLSSY